MNKRLDTLDTLRGITIISMVLFHAFWDLVFIFGASFLYWKGAYIWQQSICWSFIMIAGFASALKRPKLKRIARIFAAGLLVSTVSFLMNDPSTLIIFGVLTFISAAIFTVYLIYPLISERSGIFYTFMLAISAFLFILTKDINYGLLSLPGRWYYELPDSLYHGYFMTFWGFMDPGFYSADYFPYFPWIFLFLAGFALSKLAKPLFDKQIFHIDIPLFSFIGRHSLLIYLIHQPIIYIVLSLFLK